MLFAPRISLRQLSFIKIFSIQFQDDDGWFRVSLHLGCKVNFHNVVAYTSPILTIKVCVCVPDGRTDVGDGIPLRARAETVKVLVEVTPGLTGSGGTLSRQQ